MRLLASLALSSALSMALGACAGLAPASPQPLLRLSPASFGREVALQQRLDVAVGGVNRQLDAVLEVDATGLRLAVLVLGRTMARIEWNGDTLAESHAPGWPAVVGAERVLSDLQLMLWPADAIRAALPPGWTLEDTPRRRSLLSAGRPVVRIEHLSAGVSAMENLRAHYRIRVESRPIEADADPGETP